MMKQRPLKDVYTLRCAPGLGKVLSNELRYRNITKKKPTILMERNHDLIFLNEVTSREAFPLLRTSEQVFRCVAYGKFKISNTQLDSIANYLKGLNSDIRLAVSTTGEHFNRKFIKNWLEKNLMQRKVAFDEDAFHVLWVFCVDELYYICVEICNDSTVPDRKHRSMERHGALPPTVSAAMAFWGQISPGDTVVDLVCGTGSILAEAYGYRQDIQLIGCDIDAEAIEAAKANLRYIPNVKLYVGDSRKTELPDGCADMVISNLPFGKQFGEIETNPRLYSDLLREMLRIVRADHCKIILLTSDDLSLNTALAQFPQLQISRVLKVKVRGELATLFAIERAKL